MIDVILMGLLKANLAGGAAVIAVAAMRRLVRPRFGARAAYLLWLAPLIAAAAALAPHPPSAAPASRVVLSAQAAVSNVAETIVAQAPGVARQAAIDPAPLLFGLWVAGGLAMAALVLRRQNRFVAAMGRLTPTDEPGVFRSESPEAGPAVVGALRPRIVAPADFDARFAPAERQLILAHETAHLRAGDARVNALACALQCLAWFNPLAHLGARLLRIDQELACDAAVIGRFPDARRTYAELLLRTQIVTAPLPLGCHWPAGADHPLKARIAMLKSPLPESAMRAMGLAVAGSVALSAGGLAWSAQPSHLDPAQADKLRKPGEVVLCKPDANRELHNCEIKGSPFEAIATAADVQREWPAAAKKAGLTGWVTLQCSPNLSAQRLDHCTGYHYGGAAERPEMRAAFEQAAVRVISIIRLKAKPGPNDDVIPKGGFYTIEFNDNPAMPGGPPVGPRTTRYPDFLPDRNGKDSHGKPAAPEAKVSQAAPAAGATLVSYKPGDYVPPPGFAEPRVNGQRVQPPFRSIWLKKPKGDDIVALYPADAAAKNLTGEVLMACRVATDGRLTGCDITRVDVTGARVPSNPADDPGFGGAALQLAKLFQMKPVDLKGAPTAGTLVRIPIMFRLPAAPAPSAN